MNNENESVTIELIIEGYFNNKNLLKKKRYIIKQVEYI